MPPCGHRVRQSAPGRRVRAGFCAPISQQRSDGCERRPSADLAAKRPLARSDGTLKSSRRVVWQWRGTRARPNTLRHVSQTARRPQRVRVAVGGRREAKSNGPPHPTGHLVGGLGPHGVSSLPCASSFYGDSLTHRSKRHRYKPRYHHDHRTMATLLALSVSAFHGHSASNGTFFKILHAEWGQDYGDCARPITTREECEQAARELGHDVTVAKIDTTNARPTGCTFIP